MRKLAISNKVPSFPHLVFGYDEYSNIETNITLIVENISYDKESGDFYFSVRVPERVTDDPKELAEILQLPLYRIEEIWHGIQIEVNDQYMEFKDKMEMDEEDVLIRNYEEKQEREAADKVGIKIPYKREQFLGEDFDDPGETVTLELSEAVHPADEPSVWVTYGNGSYDKLQLDLDDVLNNLTESEALALSENGELTIEKYVFENLFKDNVSKHPLKSTRTATQLNSNTFQIRKGSAEYNEIENILIKIAEDNNISEVGAVHLAVTKNGGIASFKTAIDWGGLATGLGASMIGGNDIWGTLGTAFAGATGGPAAALGSYLGAQLGNLLNEWTDGTALHIIPWETAGMFLGSRVGPMIADWLFGSDEEEQPAQQQPATQLPAQQQQQPAMQQPMLAAASQSHRDREKIAESMGELLSADGILGIIREYIPENLYEMVRQFFSQIDIGGVIMQLVQSMAPQILGQ